MMIIAAGFRQIHKDTMGKKVVKFDQGMYNVSQKATISKQDGKDWVWCEAHADKKTGEGYAEIGGVRTKLAFNPFNDDENDDENAYATVDGGEYEEGFEAGYKQGYKDAEEGKTSDVKGDTPDEKD